MTTKECSNKELVIEFTTTPEYWDCECDEYFIHPSTKNQNSYCKVCEAIEFNSPESRENEIKYLLNEGFMKNASVKIDTVINPCKECGASIVSSECGSYHCSMTEND